MFSGLISLGQKQKESGEKKVCKNKSIYFDTVLDGEKNHVVNKICAIL